MFADLHRLDIVTLLKRYQFHATLAELVIEAGGERAPLTGLIFGGEGFAAAVRRCLTILKTIRSRFVAGVPWTRERSEHVKFSPPAFQRGGTYGVAVIGVQDQLLLSALPDQLF